MAPANERLSDLLGATPNQMGLVLGWSDWKGAYEVTS